MTTSSEEYPQNEENFSFDMSFSTLGRINFCLWRCNEASINDNVDEWFKATKTLYKETRAYMLADQIKTHEDKYKKVEEAYTRYINSVRAHVSQTRRTQQRQMFSPPREIFDQLFMWEVELRQILDKKGLLLRRGEDQGSVMMRM